MAPSKMSHKAHIFELHFHLAQFQITWRLPVGCLLLTKSCLTTCLTTKCAGLRKLSKQIFANRKKFLRSRILICNGMQDHGQSAIFQEVQILLLSSILIFESGKFLDSRKSIPELATLMIQMWCADHVISTGRRMMNLMLNVCFDNFSRNQIWKYILSTKN